MKKPTFSCQGFSILKFLLLTVLFLVVGVLVFVTFLLSPTAKWGANKYLPPLLGTATSFEEISIDIWSGDVKLKGVRVADPEGIEGAPDLFTLESLVIDVDPRSVFKDTVHIREVTIIGPSVSISRDKDGKFSFEKLKVMQEQEPEAEETPDESDSSAGKAIKIDTISIQNLSASFSDEGDATVKTVYKVTDFNFLSEGITLNPKQLAADLPAGVNFALIKLSDAQLEYQTTDLVKSQPADPAPTPETTTTEKSTADTGEAQQPVEPKESGLEKEEPLYIADFKIENVRIHYVDTPVEAEPLDVVISDFHVSALDLAFDPDGLLATEKDKILTAEMGFQVEQKAEGVNNAELSAYIKSTVIGNGIPVTAGQLQLSGMELATVGSLFPAGTQTAIGGPGFDLTARWFLAPDTLDGKIVVKSSKDVTTNVTIGGTPDKPIFSGSEMLLNVMSRPGSFINTITGDALMGGVEIVSGAADAVGELAKGAGNTVLGFGKGLFNAGKGLVTGDLKGAGKGLEEATVGTVKNAGSTVGKTTTAASDGVKGAVASGSGQTRQNAWREKSDERHKTFEAAAKQWLEDGTFPPTEPTIDENNAAPDYGPVENEQGDKDADRAKDAVASQDKEAINDVAAPQAKEETKDARVFQEKQEFKAVKESPSN